MCNQSLDIILGHDNEWAVKQSVDPGDSAPIHAERDVSRAALCCSQDCGSLPVTGSQRENNRRGRENKMKRKDAPDSPVLVLSRKSRIGPVNLPSPSSFAIDLLLLGPPTVLDGSVSVLL